MCLVAADRITRNTLRWSATNDDIGSVGRTVEGTQVWASGAQWVRGWSEAEGEVAVRFYLANGGAASGGQTVEGMPFLTLLYIDQSPKSSLTTNRFQREEKSPL